MDFKQVLSFLSKEFARKNIRYALIGGVALGAHGIVRATVDLDFLVNKEDLSKVKKIMESHNYKTMYESENVSQYLSDLKPFGAVDFLHAFRPISLSMLERAKKIAVFGGETELPVLQPEDIIGLKVQALANNTERAELERADMYRVFDHFGSNLNWNRLREYFKLFNFEELLHEYEQKFRNSE